MQQNQRNTRPGVERYSVLLVGLPIFLFRFGVVADWFSVLVPIHKIFILFGDYHGVRVYMCLCVCVRDREKERMRKKKKKNRFFKRTGSTLLLSSLGQAGMMGKNDERKHKKQEVIE